MNLKKEGLLSQLEMDSSFIMHYESGTQDSGFLISGTCNLYLDLRRF
jgi:hypothetical protein